MFILFLWEKENKEDSQDYKRIAIKEVFVSPTYSIQQLLVRTRYLFLLHQQYP